MGLCTEAGPWRREGGTRAQSQASPRPPRAGPSAGTGLVELFWGPQDTGQPRGPMPDPRVILGRECGSVTGAHPQVGRRLAQPGSPQRCLDVVKYMERKVPLAHTRSPARAHPSTPSFPVWRLPTRMRAPVRLVRAEAQAHGPSPPSRGRTGHGRHSPVPGGRDSTSFLLQHVGFSGDDHF